MSYYAGSCDVAVIGAGHAGIEAALAAARLGNHTILLYHQSGRRGKYALQPRHRRHRKGAPCAGAGRAGGRDGPRPLTMPASSTGCSTGAKAPPSIPSGAQADRGKIPAVYEAHTGIAGKSGAETGADRGNSDCGRRRHRRAHSAGGAVRRESRGYRHGNVLGQHRHHRPERHPLRP